ncbi:MAG: hypothetical protein KDA24_18290 [Deltaproteobacteria bacterium]|nr:hypothetical protein [Deltaproteobacteria bacterium]
MSPSHILRSWPALPIALLLGCPEGVEPEPITYPELEVHSQAHGCWLLQSGETTLTVGSDGVGFSAGEGTPLYAQPSDLGTVLLYDPDGGYVVGEGESLVRRTELESDATLYEDTYISGAEWVLETSQLATDRYQLRNRRTGTWMGSAGLASAEDAAAPLTFEPVEGCTPHPELALNASGTITRTTWEDGDVYGFVDMHSHMFTNFAFGGGLFHGSPFHRLGVEHALPACTTAHGDEGRRDFFGYFYDESEDANGFADLIPAMLAGELSEENHATDGYPTFSEWPDVRKRSTHQAQYYRWIERAWMGGLRLVVQHATSNSVICNLSVAEGWAPSRYGCEDMTATDRQLDAAYALERYVDAQWGGPGEGWFRVVDSPAEARAVIADGKLAVVLGIETSDLFNCHLTPRPGGPVCDEAYVDAQLDAYYARGVRVLFPNHKYDNQFTPGDGQGGFIEVGNFFNSGHYTNKVTGDCPTGFPGGFDDGGLSFSGLNEPREEFLSSPAEDMTDFPLEPLTTALPFAAALLQPPLEGDYCQNGTLTPIGEHLIRGIMQRGIVPEVDHLPRRSYLRAYEMLEEEDYPAAGTHGRDNNGRLFALGGLSQSGFGRCHDPQNPDAHMSGYRSRLQAMVDAGMHRSLGFAFDINGFARGPGPRFGPQGCGEGQEDPVAYPFSSIAGDVTFTEPQAGERLYDYNTEGMVHVGLIPEYVENARLGGATEDDLEALFRSAEGYLRMWEKAETRSEEIGAR